MPERHRPSDLFRKRLKHWRRQRGLSVRELAERVADLGGTLTAAVIYKIEQGDKTGVTIDDWLLLAHALAVPPLVLLMDLEQGTELEIAPKAVVHPWLAWRWITGEVAPVLSNRAQTRRPEWVQTKRILDLHRRVVAAEERVIRTEGMVADAQAAKAGLLKADLSLRDANAEHVEALRALASVLDEMTEAGLVTPALPADWIDTMLRFRMLTYPDHVTVYEADATAAGRGAS